MQASHAGQTLLHTQRGRKSLVEAVLCSCTAQPYLDALRFDQQSCLVVLSLYTKLHYTYHVAQAAQLWVCSHALVL